MEIVVNYTAVLLAAIAATVVGFLWYSPMILGKPWMKLMGYKEKDLKAKQKAMMPMYVLSFVGTLLMGYVLFHVATMSSAFFGYDYSSAALSSAFFMWLGFVMPVQMTATIYSQKAWKLFYIDTGYQFTAMLVMAVVLGYLA